jgi:uncharacterized membrane protein
VGQAVGSSVVGGTNVATEWSGGSVINLGGLPGSTNSQAFSINDAGLAVGISVVHGVAHAVEWINGQVIDLGVGNAFGVNEGLSFAGDLGYATVWSGGSVTILGPGSGFSINGTGQVAGQVAFATEWSGGSVIDLGGLPGFQVSVASSINDAGQVVGYSDGTQPPGTPEPSTWAMMLAGFAGLGLAGYRRAKATCAS